MVAAGEGGRRLGAGDLVRLGATDWLDGKLAVARSVLAAGELLDPAADRLYVVVIPLAFGFREILPWWLIAIIIARDVLLFATAPLLRTRGHLALPTLYIGKAATFALMSAFPWLLAGQLDSVVGTVCYPIGWAFLIWGSACTCGPSSCTGIRQSW